MSFQSLGNTNLIKEKEEYKTWFIVLKDDREFVFYFSGNELGDKLSPLDVVQEFDNGDYWSLNIDGGSDFDVDPLDEELRLIPKNKVRRVYCV